MPRRNKRGDNYPPLDLTTTPEPPVRAGQLPPGRTPFTERLKREASANERQQAARIRNGIDWSVCLVPGCGDTLRIYGTLLYGDPERRDPEKALPLCIKHQLIVWRQVEGTKRHPAIIETNETLRAKAKADADAKHEADKVRHLQRTDGQMYFIRLNGLIKVGWSRDLHQRLKQYGASAELLCHYPATRDDETNLHRQLRPALARGREWYHDTDIVQLFLNRALEQHGPPTVVAMWTEPKDVIKQRRRR